jgi:hypothetical protein
VNMRHGSRASLARGTTASCSLPMRSSRNFLALLRPWISHPLMESIPGSSPKPQPNRD